MQCFCYFSHLWRLVRGPHYLQPLALHLLEVLVVADLGHDAPDLGPELGLDLLEAGVGVLHRVVKQRAHQHRHVSHPGLEEKKDNKAKYFRLRIKLIKLKVLH